MIGCIISISLLLIFCVSDISAQSRKELESRRAKILQEINLTTRQLEKTAKTQQTELQRFNMLQEQVRKREELLQNLRSEIKSVNTQIARNRKESDKLEQEITSLQTEYASILRKTYKIKLGTDPLMLILSSDNLNQAFQRWLYVNQIKKMRTAQAGIIKEKQAVLAEKANQLENYRKQREQLLSEEESQKASITAELSEKESLLGTLKQDEQRLKQQLTEKEKQQKDLQDEIQRIIAAEIERQRKEAAAKAEAERKRLEKEALAANKEETPTTTEKEPSKPAVKPAVKPNLPATPEVQKLSADFGKNKGNLPWPVKNGTISRRFGTQAHSVLSTLSVTNNGIDIRTEPNTPVNAVFKGKVLGKKFIPGHNYMVLVQHGNYYTVYSNLGNVLVKDGQQISSGQVLGNAADNGDATTEVHFEIWKDQLMQDPSLWLKK